MALTLGTRLGVYQITTLIGEGGMGQVYRATDTTLGRQVAIKVLPDAFAADPDRLARFEREAKTLASLNHPHIAAIYAVEKSAGLHALVMELVEGDDLSQRIARGAIPVDEALPIARQIAEALDAAHEQGIIHRDLKPANIKVRADGTVKVLDFGLAKAMEPAGAIALGNSMAPTITTPAMTQARMILGTAAYMSPEQARGKPVDKRADIWAFGAVLFEMLTGRRAFPGEDITDTIVSVVSKEPDWSALPSATPAGLRRLLGRCLKKDAKARLRDIGEARVQVEELLSGAPGEMSTAASGALGPQPIGAAPSSASRGRVAWMIAAAAVVVAAALTIPAARYLRETPPLVPPETRVDIVTPATDNPADFALSPDGRQIAFVASGDGAPRLWLRSLATTTAQPLAGTEGATLPFWAPDSRSIGFFSAGALKRLDVGGSGAGVTPQTLVPAVGIAIGGTWNADGVILFASNARPVMRVSATGGITAAVTTLGQQQQSHRQPWFLPDGRGFLFYVLGGPDTTGIYLSTLDGGAPVRLTPADSAGVYLPSEPAPNGPFRGGGWLLWVRAGALVAQRLDVARAALTGEPVTLADGVAVDPQLNTSALTVAATGLVAYRAGASGPRQLTWVDRSGTTQGAVGDPDASFLMPRVSPDGRRVVVARTVQGNTDLWLLDGIHASRITFETSRDDYPVWSPDGTRIGFRSIRTGQFDLYQKFTSDSIAEERLVASDQLKVATSWSADGRFLLSYSIAPETSYDIWALPMTADRPSMGSGQPEPDQGRRPFVFLKTPFMERWGAFSPDGRWVAYQSNESGRNEIYVRPFTSSGAGSAGGGGQWQVSSAGGIYPTWRPDGQELYYINPAGAMTAVPLTVSGATFESGEPVVLFPTRIVGGAEMVMGKQYDVAPDGRFLINTELDSADAPITLLTNWNPEPTK